MNNRIQRTVTIFLLFFGIAFGVVCGQGSSNSYWPLAGTKQWVTKGWTVASLDGVKAWQHTGSFTVKGIVDTNHGTWQVVEVAEVISQESLVYGTAFLRMEDDKIEIMGYSPGSFSGSTAGIIEPSTGPLAFSLSQSQVGIEQKAQFQVHYSYSTINVMLNVTVEARGIALETAAGNFDDVMVLNVAINSSEADGGYSSYQTVRVYLARGYGPIRAEKTKDQIKTGGDFLRQ